MSTQAQQLVALSFAAGAAFLCWTYLRRQASSPRKLTYPPGPPPKSLLYGNLSDIPKTKPWITYAEWGNLYGDIIHLRIFGQHTIILNSVDVVRDLIERRSHIYSDRPDVPIVNLMEWDFNAGLKPFGPSWKAHRRLFDQVFKPSASMKYRVIQARKINDLLYGLLTTPEDLKNHYRTAAAAIIMSAVYGYDIVPKGDYFVTLAEAAVAKLSESVFPGANAVNALPILRYIPAWFPGAGFKRFANETKMLTRQMRELPFEFVKKGMAEGAVVPCIVSELLTNISGEPSPEAQVQAIKEVAATAYAAGSDTTVSALGTFFYAMAMCPEVQTKAQKEIDAIIGTNRLVTSEDRDSLPYIEAIYREILRWRPAAPLGVARCALEEDVYKGYYIPKGATVLMNMWAMSHDPRKYKDPEAFNPDRHFDDKGKLLAEDDSYAFGCGRRVCSGKYMASATVWLTIAAVLSTFKIQKKKDASGNEIPLDGQYTDALVSHPLPFECSIIPRSEEAAQLILEVVGKKA